MNGEGGGGGGGGRKEMQTDEGEAEGKIQRGEGQRKRGLIVRIEKEWIILGDRLHLLLV